jgi:ornithine decarboxylase
MTKKLIKHLDTQETPLFFLDTSVATAKVRNFKQLLPKVKPYYAVKSLNDEQLIRAIDEQVAGFDIASWGEAQWLLSLGIDPKRLFFSNPVKVPQHISLAFEAGISNFAFDSIDEVKKLAQLAPGSNVYLRIKVTDEGSVFPLSAKFGVDPIHAVSYCGVAHDAGLHVIGVSFHVGSQSTNTEAWLSALTTSRDVIKRLTTAGFDIRLLNIGGGFPADYGNGAEQFDTLAPEIGAYIASEIHESIEVIAEPGRYISANAGMFIATVIGTELRSGKPWLYLDIGTFQGLIEPLEMDSWRYPMTNIDKPDITSETASFTITGPTCDACDTVGTDILLPKNTEVGDRIKIDAAGAYSIVYASNFNGFSPPKTVYI